MKKKNLLWTLAAAFALASCSDTELVEMPPQAQEQNAIEFSTYLGDNAQGRATIVTTDTIARDGFGVNAWYTKGKKFTDDDVVKEAFMTNTKVTRNENNVWTYSPLKYWPNNAGHMVSFFAYGPYKLPTSSSFNEEKTAINFTVESDAKKQVDLIYNSNYSTIDMPKPAVNTHVKFDFKHALARIAFSVEAAVDVVESNKDQSANIDANTVINVKRVALVGADAIDGDYTYDESTFSGPFYKEGTLTLLNPGDGISPWTIAEEQKSKVQGFVLDADNFYRTVEYDSEEVVQLHKFNRKQQLTNDASYLMIIPQDLRTTENGGSSEGFKIYIEYDVITEGENGDPSTITNHIVSKEAMSVNFEQGMAYKFNLVLGMTSVKFDASVAEWDNAADDAYDNEEWLPENESGDLNYVATSEFTGFEIRSKEDMAKMRDLINSGAQYTVTNGKATIVKTDGRSTRAESEPLYFSQANYKLTTDIDLSTVLDNGRWVPIGLSSRNALSESDGELPEEQLFNNATFDGGNHTISGVIFGKNPNTASDDGDLIGLFSYTFNATIKDLNVVGTVSEFDKMTCFGGIISMALETNLTNCHYEGNIVSALDKANMVGGIIGDGIANIINCSYRGNIDVYGDAGALASMLSGEESEKGTSLYGHVIGSYTIGSIKVTVPSEANAKGSSAGLVGSFPDIDYFSPCVISGCYTTMNVSGAKDYTGSLVGTINNGAAHSITGNAYAATNGVNAFGSVHEDYKGNNNGNYVAAKAADEGVVAWYDDTDTYNALTLLNNALSQTTYAYHYVDNTASYTDGSTTVFPLTIANGAAAFVTLPKDNYLKEFIESDLFPTLYVKTVEDLQNMAYNINNDLSFTFNKNTYKYAEVYYMQTADIDLNITSWTPIGTSSNKFKGKYSVKKNDDSEFYSIKNFKITDIESDLALFGYSTGTISDIVMKDCELSGKRAAAIALESTGTISGCKVTDGSSITAVGISNSTGDAAGIVLSATKVVNCENAADVTTGKGWIGGIVAVQEGNTIEYCRNSGDITNETNTMTGGIVGYMHATTCKVVACYNDGNVKSAHISGGIAGYGSGSITACYNTGKISSTTNSDYGVAGIVGSGNGINITACYNTGEISATNEKAVVGGIHGNIDKRDSNNPTYNACYYSKEAEATYSGAGYNYSADPDGAYGDRIYAGDNKVGIFCIDNSTYTWDTALTEMNGQLTEIGYQYEENTGDDAETCPLKIKMKTE